MVAKSQPGKIVRNSGNQKVLNYHKSEDVVYHGNSRVKKDSVYENDSRKTVGSGKVEGWKAHEDEEE